MRDGAVTRHPELPLGIAHRFGNGLPQLRAAESAGVDVIELDVWHHRGRLEVRHAHSLGPLPFLWDHGRFHRKPPVPLLLDDVLAAAAPTTGFMIDLKGAHAALPDAVLAALEDRGAGRTLLVSARFWDFLPSLRVHPGLVLFHSIGSERGLRRVWPRLLERENDAVSIAFGLLSEERVRRLHERARIVATWPVNDERRLDDALRWGVDGIISDDLEVLRTLASKRVAR